MPLTYIGDMPRELLASAKWELCKIDLNEAQCGDILFAKNRQRPKLLSHIALVIGVDQIFHCTPIKGTAVIQSCREFFASYEQRLDDEEVVCYIDPRNKRLREEQKGIFIKV